MNSNRHISSIIFSAVLALIFAAGTIILPVSAQAPPAVSDFAKTGVKNTAVNIIVAEPTANQPPVATDMSITTDKNEPVSDILTATDPDNDPLVFSIDTQPKSGTVKITDEAKGSFTYTPKFNATGADSFKFKANDGTADSNIATVTIMIKEPAPPIFKYEDLVNHWASFSAGKLADRGVIIGEKIADKYYFYPDKQMNRAEFNLFLNAALEIDSDPLGAEPVGYTDEDKIPIWALHEARAAKKAGLINGVKVGNKLYYNATGKINRLETLVILHNALKPAANNDDPLEYADKNQIPKWAVQYVKNMRSYGIMKGNPNNTISPNDIITRAQAAELLYQLVKYKELNP